MIILAKVAFIELPLRTELILIEKLRMFIFQDLALEMLGHTCVLGAWLCLNCMGHHVWKVKRAAHMECPKKFLDRNKIFKSKQVSAVSDNFESVRFLGFNPSQPATCHFCQNLLLYENI